MSAPSSLNSPSPVLYETLDKTRPQVRLLEICPAESDEAPVEVKLCTRFLDDAVGSFIPFSYVWGDPEDTEPILVNGITKQVTRNLASLLRMARRHALADPPLSADSARFRGTFFWADAICINQDDTDERSHQVGLMESIYSNAPLVAAWLGEGRNAHLAAHVIATIAKCRGLAKWWDEMQTAAAEGTDMIDPDPDLGGWMAKYPEFWQQDTEELCGNTYWNAVDCFLDAAYWDRVWTFQEVVLPADGLFLHGSSLIKRRDAMALAPWFLALDRQPISGLAFVNERVVLAVVSRVMWKTFRLSRIQQHVDDRLLPMRPANLQIVYACWNLCASDPRDKIYGLLGLMNSDIVADYTKDTRDVFCGFFATWIRAHGNLEFLDRSDIANHLAAQEVGQNQVTLPSWIPRSVVFPEEYLTNKRDTVSGLLGPLDAFCPSKGLSVSSAHVSESIGRLKVSGVLCERIKEVEGSWRSFDDGSGRRDILAGFFYLTAKWSKYANNQMAFPPAGTGNMKEKLLEEPTQDPAITVGQALFRITFLDGHPKYGTRLDMETEETRALAMDFIMTIAMAQGTTEEQGRDGLSNAIKVYSLLGLGDYHGPPNEEGQESMGLPAKFLRDWLTLGTRQQLNFVRYQDSLDMNVTRKVKFLTERGCVGVAASACPGDLISVVAGCTTPMILRQTDSGYEVVAPCFVLGYMDGEAKDMVDRGEAEIETLTIL
ncbi:heterokaryon incompatibility protein-domain-containing protein [Echria macrotheca]|uniref:Heterokaryon incompatibility protein-domain-containing protein n=1 Tax=Echria macrotheca TaxID=438768 RepID=A0AAJ0F595_9PEZI|nr:heterokaryon incompatibility protein-domain-containing protein [Echria macrotheca]